MYLLDTNHCTFILEGESTVIERFREKASVRVATSVIVTGELQFMAQNSQQKRECDRTLAILLPKSDRISSVKKEDSSVCMH